MPVLFLSAWTFAPVQIPGLDQLASTLLAMSFTTTVGIYVMSAIAGMISTPSHEVVKRMREEMEARRWGS